VPLLNPGTQLCTAGGIHNWAKTHPAVSRRAHGTVLTRGVGDRSSTLFGAHIICSPARNLKFGVRCRIAVFSAVSILKQHLTGAAYEHRAKRFGTRFECFLGEFNTAAQMRMIGGC